MCNSPSKAQHRRSTFPWGWLSVTESLSKVILTPQLNIKAIRGWGPVPFEDGITTRNHIATKIHSPGHSAPCFFGVEWRIKSHTWLHRPGKGCFRAGGGLWPLWYCINSSCHPSPTIATTLEAFTSHRLSLEDKRFLKGFYIYLGLLKPSALWGSSISKLRF